MKCISAAIIFVAVISTGSCLAGARHFNFLYEAPTSAPGSLEFENWMTWKRGTDPQRSDAVEFRHELEYGVTDRFQASLYLPDWSYDATPDGSGWTLKGGAVEFIYNLTNPVDDPVGLSLYQEYKVGYEIFEWESKVILQKNIGRWIVAYNATLEAVWEGDDLEEREGEFTQAIGASYEISHRVSVGAELVHEMVFPGWHDQERIRNVFVGPNVSYRHKDWFVTVSAVAQATDTADEPDFQVRTVFGIGL